MTDQTSVAAKIVDCVRLAKGDRDAQTARRLLALATELGAVVEDKPGSPSIRVPGRPGATTKEITLFLIAKEAGTFYIRWVDRWLSAGVAVDVGHRFKEELEQLFGSAVNGRQMHVEKAVPLEKVARNFAQLEAILRRAVEGIWDSGAGRSETSASSAAIQIADESAIEGVATEARAIRTSRSAKLRDLALKASGGVCEACEVNFGATLAGKGWRVLQVHHRNQLSLRDEPQITSASELAVLCANCHMLVHLNPGSALPVSKLRTMFRTVQKPGGAA